MHDTATVPVSLMAVSRAAGRRPLIDDELAEQLLGRAQAEGAELLSQLTKAVLERALVEELTGHLGYDKHDPAGRGSGNSRNGATPKTVLSDVGAVDLAVPRRQLRAADRPQGPDPAGRVQREDHHAVCARDDHQGHPGAPAADV